MIQVIVDNRAAGVEPAIWKVAGLDTTDAARAVVAQIRRLDAWDAAWSAIGPRWTGHRS